MIKWNDARFSPFLTQSHFKDLLYVYGCSVCMDVSYTCSAWGNQKVKTQTSFQLPCGHQEPNPGSSARAETVEPSPQPQKKSLWKEYTTSMAPIELLTPSSLSSTNIESCRDCPPHVRSTVNIHTLLRDSHWAGSSQLASSRLQRRFPICSWIFSHLPSFFLSPNLPCAPLSLTLSFLKYITRGPQASLGPPHLHHQGADH